MKPKPLTKNALVATLRNMADLVEQEDSYEGSIQYMMPSMEDDEAGIVPEGTYAMVMASYRIGNSVGQGGIRLIGEVE